MSDWETGEVERWLKFGDTWVRLSAMQAVAPYTLGVMSNTKITIEGGSAVYVTPTADEVITRMQEAWER